MAYFLVTVEQGVGNAHSNANNPINSVTKRTDSTYSACNISYWAPFLAEPVFAGILLLAYNRRVRRNLSPDTSGLHGDSDIGRFAGGAEKSMEECGTVYVGSELFRHIHRTEF